MNKTFLYLLTVCVILGSFKYFIIDQQQQNSEENEVLNKRSFFKKWGKKAHENDSKLSSSQIDFPEIVTYGVHILINTGSKNGQDDKLNHQQENNLTAQCDVQTIYDEEQNVYDIAVSYSMVINHDIVLDEEQKKQPYTEENEDYLYQEEEYLLDGEEYEKPIQDLENLFFLLRVDADSGEILQLFIETFYEENQLITFTTQQLINDIFPELRQKSFSIGNIEQDNLGSAKVDYIQEKIDENIISITKEYNSDDYVEFVEPEIKYPDTEYERVVLVDVESGLVNEGETDFKFNLETKNTKLSESQETVDGENVYNVFGQIMGEVKAQFWIINPSENDQDIASEMYRYRNAAIFESKRLNKDIKASITYGSEKPQQFEFVDIREPNEIVYIDDEELYDSTQSDIVIRYKNSETDYKIQDDDGEALIQQKLSQSSGKYIFQQTNILSTVYILGNTIHVQVKYTMYDYVTVMTLQFVVNNKHTVNIMQAQFDNCQQKNDKKIITEDYEFFYADYPIYPPISIPVQAMGKISYGYNVIAQRDQNKACSLKIQPVFKASLYGDGQISVADVISAGVYAEGFFLDSSLTFTFSTKRGLSQANVVASFKSYKIDMGIVYQLLECSLKNLLKQEKPQKNQQQQEKLQIFGSITKPFKSAYTSAKKGFNYGINQTKKAYKNLEKQTIDQINRVKNIPKVAYETVKNPSDPQFFKMMYDMGVDGMKMKNRIVQTTLDHTKVCKQVQKYKSLYSNQEKAQTKTLYKKSVNYGI